MKNADEVGWAGQNLEEPEGKKKIAGKLSWSGDNLVKWNTADES